MKKTDITGQTKVGDLLESYPPLLEYLVQMSPEYRKLKNPVLRHAMARVANLSTVARMGGFELDDFLSRLRKEVERMGAGNPDSTPKGPEVEGGADKKEILKEILLDLERGVDVEILKERFANLIRDIDATEIAELEQELIREGMPEAKIKELCDLHVSIFKQSLDRKEQTKAPPGHPVDTLMMENAEAKRILAELAVVVRQLPDATGEERSKAIEKVSGLLKKLRQVDRHFLRKENQLFPVLEAHGISGPTQVMWALHDDIRSIIKDLRGKVESTELDDVPAMTEKLVRMMADMIYKEEHILFPMSIENLSEEDWIRVRRGEEEIGYAWIKPAALWPPKPSDEGVATRAEEPPKASTGTGKESFEVGATIALETGTLSPKQLNLILKNLPVDISFVNDRDEVVYYSAGKNRVFPRSPGVIGRKVQNCHPPRSVPIVNEILESFRGGKKDVAEFWIQLGDKFVDIKYVAVRDSQGRYMGTLEISQDATELRKLEGEKRLLDWSAPGSG